MTVLHIDFETRSAVDLKAAGVYVYAESPTTDVWCAAYAFDDGPIKRWRKGEPCPAEIVDHVLAGGEIVAYNAQFERIIWWLILSVRYDWPRPALEQFRCIMAEAYAMSLPGRLEAVAPALGLDVVKDMAGHRLMLQMSKPRKINPDGTIVWWDEPDKLDRLYAYCDQDVDTERGVEKRVLRLRPAEREIWLLDQRINDRGVYIDQDLCLAAKTVVAQATAAANDEINRITGGAVTACSNISQLKAWLAGQGLGEIVSLAKDVLEDLLIRDDLSPAARRAIELRQAVGKASTAKIDAMLRRRGRDGRMRGNLQYHGAGTGRWAARGAQLQNLPRPKEKDIPGAIETLLMADADLVEMLYGSPLHIVSDCIRSMIAAPAGRGIVSSDFSNIEGRVLAWLAGEETKLDRFRAYDAGNGPDIYLVTAGSVFNVPHSTISKDDPRRQVGKVAELSLGFQGGPGALAKMGKNYGFKPASAFGPVWESATAANRDAATDAWASRGKRTGMAREGWLAAELIKLAWRQAHPEIVQFWHDLERAAIEAVANPGQTVSAGLNYIAYRKVGSFLFCRRPGGGAICYPYPRLQLQAIHWETLERKDIDWREAARYRDAEGWGVKEHLVYKAESQFTKRWEDKAFYGGLAAENVTQAVARDIMAEAMVRVDRAGYPLILTVHDEVVSERAANEINLAAFNAVMRELPGWAAGLPVAVDGWTGPRYRK